MSILEARKCPVCFVEYGAPTGFFDQRREDKKSFYCPNGHSLSYTESKADVLQRELNKAKQNAAYLEERAKKERELREAAERQVSAARGQVTKMRNRAAHGVCPCCNRTFSQLARHMATKHPEFVGENVVALKGGKP